jgi:molybdopterin/thiamine biosynthesis adenylyltransferase
MSSAHVSPSADKSMIVFSAEMFDALRTQLLARPDVETAGILLAGVARDANRLLAREVILAPDEAYLRRDIAGLTLTPRFLADAMKRARSGGWSLILAHSHPGHSYPSFSNVDDECERLLMPVFAGRAPGVPHGTLVVGLEGEDARLYSIAGERLAVGLRTVGSELHDGAAAAETPVAHIFERNVRAFGEAGQTRIAKLHVGIVGLGGTGSVIAQELALLGVTHFTLIDRDEVELTNLNRLVGATRNDIGRAKVDVARDLIMRSNPVARVHVSAGDVTRREEGERLMTCDLIFSATDSHGSRAILNHLSYAYYIPVIDLGIVITADSGRVTDVTGRVQLLGPGAGCLVCGNLLDAEEVRQDFLTQDERQRDPYIVGERVPQPAVISLNAIVSSLAVTMFLGIVTGIPLAARHQIYRGIPGTVRSVATPPLANCIVCSLRGVLGRGDAAPPPWRP